MAEANGYAILLQDDENRRATGRCGPTWTARRTRTTTCLSTVKTPSIAQADSSAAQVLFKRTGDLSEEATVYLYGEKGKAQSGVDFQPLSGSLVTLAGKSRAKLKIEMDNNSTHEGARHFRIQLLSSPTGDYDLGAETKAKI